MLGLLRTATDPVTCRGSSSGPVGAARRLRQAELQALDFEHLLVKFSKACRCEGRVAGDMQKHKYCLRENAPMRDLVGNVVRDAYVGIVTNGN